jgi:hypothetical protein
MNKRRRRIGRRRRAKVRVIREFREWSRTHDGMTETPSGRLRRWVLAARSCVVTWERQIHMTGLTLRRSLDGWLERSGFGVAT